MTDSPDFEALVRFVARIVADEVVARLDAQRPPPAPPPPVTRTGTLTDVQVAARLGVSRFTVRSWRATHDGPRFLKLGRAIRYRHEDVDEYERQRAAH